MLFCLTSRSGKNRENHYLSIADSILQCLNLYQTEDGLLTKRILSIPTRKYLSGGRNAAERNAEGFFSVAVFRGWCRVVCLYQSDRRQKYKRFWKSASCRGWNSIGITPLAGMLSVIPSQIRSAWTLLWWQHLDCTGLLRCTNWLTKPTSLEKAVALYQYIYSGWSDEMGGGIFGVNSKKEAKHTCSNAPSTVLGVKLYRLTKDAKYPRKKAKETYAWTKNIYATLPTIFTGITSTWKGKFQRSTPTTVDKMIQAGVLLYEERRWAVFARCTVETAAGTDAFFRTKSR